MYKSILISIVIFSIFAISVFYSFYSLTPHTISDNDTSPHKFSTSRAMKHIKFIADEHHFVGTAHHKKVREYLVSELQKLGLNTEIQSRFSINEKWGGATMNHNILARIKGTGNGKAVMLLSHYDSAPFASKGASDDAVGVATILEGLRAFIKSGVKHQNDIIILFSDGEEIGLNGAKAFVENHPWARDIGVVINFEARGSGGPSFTLLETNGGNEMMVKSFAKASCPYPVANSFLYSVYKMLPNDTDLTMFREIGNIEGYNFAFIDDFYDYHTSYDNYENIDINTVEHQGSYLMAMIGYFKNYDTAMIKSKKDYVYFTFPFLKIIYYPFSFAVPLYLFFVVCFISLIIAGIYLKKIKVKKISIGLLFSTGLILGAVLFSHLLWKLITFIHPSYSDILHGFPYNGHDYIAAFAFIACGLTSIVSFKVLRNNSAAEIIIPVAFLWLLISGFLTFRLTGASFFIIPAAILTLILAIDFFVNLETETKLLIYAVLLIPFIIILSPFIQMFPVGLKMNFIPLSVFLTVMIVLTLLPVLHKIRFNKMINYAILFFGVLFFVRAEFRSGFNEERPRHESINYVLYTDEKKAFWETNNTVMEPWIQSIMGKNIKAGSFMENYLSNKYNDQVKFHAPAKLIDLKQPVIKLLKDSITGNERHIKFRIEPQRNSCYLELLNKKGIIFKNFELNGIRFRKEYLDFSKRTSIISYYLTEKGETPEVSFMIDKNSKPQLLLYEASYDLAGNKDLNIAKRPDNSISMPFVLSDLIITVNNLKF
ncbi:MAG: M20/M25/M40 family metallo-hydrolase [Deltaproteobacteria bacterium]